MADYRVVWEIDVIADTPVEAARLAREAQTAPDTSAVVFDVFGESICDDSLCVRVDLLEIAEAEEDARVARSRVKEIEDKPGELVRGNELDDTLHEIIRQEE